MSNSSFTNAILEWYQANKRMLPWRENSDPYRVWLSEIILQQTRVAQGTPYFLAFLEQYPSVTDLAKAPEADVLRLWQGLGYYSRARNLHKCAQTVTNQFAGKFPTTYDELLKLPGIGPYTAAAIASISFNETIPVVDGNVYRVLSRAFNIDVDIANGTAYKTFFELAAQHIDSKQPGNFNQAVMELGALVCSPKSPSCSECCINHLCQSRQLGIQEQLPVKTKKTKKRDRYFNYIDLILGKNRALRQRTSKDIWQGLFEFYLIETTKPTAFDTLGDELLQSIITSTNVVQAGEPTIKHVLSHQNLHTSFIRITLDDTTENRAILKRNGLTLYDQEEADNLAKPILIANYLNRTAISIDL